MTAALAEPSVELVPAIEALDARLRWLSAWTVHNANNIRAKRDGMKVGGHQASCASMTTIMAAL
jgi:pyruvate dehydrogenase E1 component